MKKSEVETAADKIIEDALVQFHHFEGTCLIVCAITPKHGFTVYGTACCIDYEDFDLGKGQQIAFDKARSEIWVYEGYRGIANTVAKEK